MQIDNARKEPGSCPTKHCEYCAKNGHKDVAHTHNTEHCGRKKRAEQGATSTQSGGGSSSTQKKNENKGKGSSMADKRKQLRVRLMEMTKELEELEKADEPADSSQPAGTTIINTVRIVEVPDEGVDHVSIDPLSDNEPIAPPPAASSHKWRP